MRKPLIGKDITKKRREALKPQLEDAALIVLANKEVVRNHDVNYPFRQDSNFFYLTGFEEPDAVLVFRPGKEPETTMFVRPKDPLMETWEGFRFGPEATVNEFGVDEAYVLDELPKRLPDLLKDVNQIHHRFGQKEFDLILEGALEKVRKSFGRSGKGLLPILDYWEQVGEARVIKSEEEIEWMKTAADISVEAHKEAMKFTKPGVTERQVLAVLEYHFKMAGAARPGYNSIVASGSNATTLHYTFNDQRCQEGDLLLIDAGAEYNYYSADITRTFPVSGKYSSVQKEVYDRVLDVQTSTVALARVGASFVQLQNHAVEGLTQAMVDFGLLKGKKEDLIEKKLYRKYYPHNIGHFLGLDVHDLGLYTKGKEPRPFEPGMVITIEPGLYVPPDDEEAPKEFRGIGIRIEDDILITSGDPNNLTEKVPKAPAQIEDLMAP